MSIDLARDDNATPVTALDHIRRAQRILMVDEREGQLADYAWRMDAHLRIARLLLDHESMEHTRAMLQGSTAAAAESVPHAFDPPMVEFDTLCTRCLLPVDDPIHNGPKGTES